MSKLFFNRPLGLPWAGKNWKGKEEALSLTDREHGEGLKSYWRFGNFSLVNDAL